jgi:hypothetical protein
MRVQNSENRNRIAVTFDSISIESKSNRITDYRNITRGGSINRNRNRDYLKNRNRHDYAKIEKIDNRLKNNRNTIIFAIISSVSKVDDLKIKIVLCVY